MPTRHASFRVGRLAWAMALGVMAGCTVGPNFVKPDATTPDEFADRQRAGHAAEAAPEPSVTVPSDPDPQWWKVFNDTQLDSLVDRAIAGNLGLQEAVYRILASRVQEQGARAAGLPNVRATASYNREQLGLKGMLESRGVYGKVDQLAAPDSPLNTFQPGLGTQASDGAHGLLNQITAPANLYQVGFDASWELDLFGRVRRSVEAAGAQTQAAVESRNDALVSLEAEVAQTYAQLRGAQELERITRDEIELEQQVHDLTQSRQQSGLASQTEVESTAAQLASLQSQLPQLEQDIAQALNGLALLLGQPPGTLDAELAQPAAIPPVPPTVPVGLPASLARRRPDIRHAEATLHAATAGVGQSVAQLFPDLSLTGQFGLRSTEANYLTNWASHFYSFGPQLSLPIFNGGALRAQVKVAQAQQAAAVLEYRQTVLTALHDVDNALVVYRTDQSRRAAVERAAQANRRSFELARNGYGHGLVSFIEVLDAERQSAQSRTQLAQSTLQVTTDLVALYKALGGGWQDKADVPEIGTLGNGGKEFVAPDVGSVAAAPAAAAPKTPAATVPEGH